MEQPTQRTTEPEILYDLQTRWDQLNIPKLLLLTSTFYLMEEMIAHPLEVIRTKLQVDNKPFSLNSVRNVVRVTGIRGCYTAFWTCALGFIPGNLAYIASYQWFKDYFQGKYNKWNPQKADGSQAPIVSFAAGFWADALAVTLYCPIDVISQRRFIQDQSNQVYSSTLDAVRKIKVSEGYRGFFKGFVPLFVNSLPASAIWYHFSFNAQRSHLARWTLYESSKTHVSKWLAVMDRNKTVSTTSQFVVGQSVLAQFLSGLFAGGITAFVTNPLDVVRTRLQTQDLPKASNSNTLAASPYYTGSLHAIREIFKREGSTAFIKGIGPRTVSWSLLSGGSAYLYEFSVKQSRRKDL